ncbi:MAG: dockerin type I repeat-containing protein [Planctomycetes bacterium]|nr:dockerin type I repeat-containing protein [Planctomycetota bacterium]
MKSNAHGVIAIACVAVLFGAGPAGAYVDSVGIAPQLPAPGDVIFASVAGNLPDGCWHFLGFEVSVSGREIAIKVKAEEQPGPCPDVLVPYSFEVKIEKLEAGAYTLVVLDPQEKKAIDFEVRPLTLFTPGEVNGDGQLDIGDAVFILSYLFSDGPAPACESAANVNGDDQLDLGDPVYLLAYLFASGPHLQTLATCFRDIECVENEWIVDCLGNWTCDCGKCRERCGGACGDGICDRRRGESPQSCPQDCRTGDCRPVCLHIGTRSEGWYDGCTGELFQWAFCADCEPICRLCGSKSEGWYDSCTGELITWDSCCEEEETAQE